jgi:hypothetical protein
MSNDPIPGPAISGRLDGAGTDAERGGDLRLRQPGVVAEHEDFAAQRGQPREPVTNGMGSTAIDDAALIIVDVSSASTRP